MSALHSKLETSLKQKTETCQAGIDKLNQRLAALEQKVEDEKAAILKEVQQRNAQLTRQLNEFMVRRCMAAWQLPEPFIYVHEYCLCLGFLLSSSHIIAFLSLLLSLLLFPPPLPSSSPSSCSPF